MEEALEAERQESERRRLLIQKEEQIQQILKRKNKQALLDDLVSNKTRGFECSVTEQIAITLTLIFTMVKSVALTYLLLCFPVLHVLCYCSLRYYSFQYYKQFWFCKAKD